LVTDINQAPSIARHIGGTQWIFLEEMGNNKLRES
jgi:hypothetical protein